MKHVSSSSSDVLGVSVAEDFFFTTSVCVICRPSMKVPSCKVSKCLDPKLVSRPLALRRYSFLKVRGWEAKGRGAFLAEKKTEL